MGLEVGFNIWKIVDSHKLEPIKLSDILKSENDDADCDTFSCGRCDVNNAWALTCSSKEDCEEVCVFVKDFDGYTIKNNYSDLEYTTIFKYKDFNSFKEYMNSYINKEIQQHRKYKDDLLNNIAELHTKIDKYQQLQMGCTKSNEYAFNRFQEFIEELEERIKDLKDTFSTYDYEDYDYTAALRCEKMLDLIELLLNQGYVITNYYA